MKDQSLVLYFYVVVSLISSVMLGEQKDWPRTAGTISAIREAMVMIVTIGEMKLMRREGMRVFVLRVMGYLVPAATLVGKKF